MKFVDIEKGVLARKRGVECTTLAGKRFLLDLRVLDAEQEAQCVAAACKAARDAGGEPVETDLSYQLAFCKEVVALAAIDHDAEAAEPFFKSAEEVGKGLDRERILLIAGIHRRFQEQVSPVKHQLSEDEAIELVHDIATSEEGAALPPFEDLPRFTQNHFVRFMARLLAFSLPPKSLRSLTDVSAAENSH